MNNKISKKIVIPFVSTVMGFALIGGIGGSFAWYQYNSRATASFIGTSVAQGGSLQISNDGTNFGRNVYPYSTNKQQLFPVTFGKMGANNALPANAYYEPHYGQVDFTTWKQAAAGSQYVQFDVYLRTMVADGTAESGYVRAAMPVYLDQIVLADATSTKIASEALRVHIAVEGGSNFLISHGTVTDMPLYGTLDLDGVEGADKQGDYIFDEGYDTSLIYGQVYDGQNPTNPTQTCTAAANMVVTRESDGTIDPTTNASKLICTTLTQAEYEANSNKDVKMTVTVWLEGWQQYNFDANNPAMWNPSKTGFTDVNVGLRFDVGDVF